MFGEEPLIYAEADVLSDQYDAAVFEPELRVASKIRRRSERRRGGLDTTVAGALGALRIARCASTFAWRHVGVLHLMIGLRREGYCVVHTKHETLWHPKE